MILYRYHDTSWLPKSMCNPKDNLVRMTRTLFGIGTIRKCVVSVLEVEVKLKLPIVLEDVNNHTEILKDYKVVVEWKEEQVIDNSLHFNDC